MRVFIYLGVDGWLIGLAAAATVVVFIRRREVGFALLAIAVIASFVSRLIASWLLVHSSEIMTPPTLAMRIASACDMWIAPLCLVVGFVMLGVRKPRALTR